MLTVRGSVRKDSVNVPGIIGVDDSLGRFNLCLEAEGVRNTYARGGVGRCSWTVSYLDWGMMLPSTCTSVHTPEQVAESLLP